MAKQWPQMIGIGSTVYDTLMMVPRFPEEATKLEGLETKVQGGGPCATALVAARKLGVSSAYMGTSGMIRLGAICWRTWSTGAWIRTMCAVCPAWSAFTRWCF